uniref:Uncharacterized protein n=1 Tax=Salix viminalis TaxID=40686 RepID=A0A6N2N616_SALVM
MPRSLTSQEAEGEQHPAQETFSQCLVVLFLSPQSCRLFNLSLYKRSANEFGSNTRLSHPTTTSRQQQKILRKGVKVLCKK